MNTADIIINEQTITVTPQNVQGLVKYAEGGYAVIFEDGTSLSISQSDYNKIKALDYSQGGGGAGGGIQSSTINNMEFDGDKTLTINGTPFEGGGGDVPADLVEKVEDHQTVLYGNGGGEGGYDYTCLDPNADFAKTYDVQSHVMEVGAVCQDANWLSRFDGPDVKCNFIFCDLSQIQGTQYYGVNLQDTNSEWTGEFYVVVKENVGTYNFDTIKFVDINGNQHACRLSFQSEKLMVISDTSSDVFSTNDESKINLPSGGDKGLIDRVSDLENKPAIPLKYNDGNIYDNEGNVVCGTYDDDQSERKINGVKSGNGTIEITEDRLTDNKTLTIGGMEVAKANPYSKAVSVFGVDVAGGGSNMVYNTATGKLSGAKDQNGNDVEFEVGSITITI